MTGARAGLCIMYRRSRIKKSDKKHKKHFPNLQECCIINIYV